MVTYRPFGFISYNSYGFLKFTLDKLVTDETFFRCACWYHESLNSEKDHFHCWIEPNHSLNTDLLKPLFDEVNEDGSHQSIAIRPRCGSKFPDAYLYGIHDSDYLQSKGKRRELVNIQSDKHIYIGDFKEDIEDAEFYRFKSCLAPYQIIKNLVDEGLSLADIYIRLRTPFSQMSAVRMIYRLVRRTKFVVSNIDDISEEDKSPFEDIQLDLNGDLE